LAGLSPLTDFALAARAHDDALDLEALCVGIARMARPDVDAATVAAQLDALAAAIAEDVDPSLPPDRLAARLTHTIGGTLDFRGDTSLVPSADSSFLDRVIESRRGLPILLSVVWILLGKRLGVPIAGVSYPGHFLVCLDAPGARIFLDPFGAGRERDAGELLARLGNMGGDRKLLEPCGIRAIVTRMLVNLKNLWVDRNDYTNALAAVDRILLVAGELPLELRDRGLICLHLERPAEAGRDFKRYLKVRPDAEDRPVIEALLERIEGAT
jgi:regulator of sirC expression with transglutaminase-like and TPR domain